MRWLFPFWLCLSSCAMFWRPSRDPAVRAAAEVQDLCRAPSDRDDALVTTLLDRQVIESVAPLYRTVRAGRGYREARLLGARVLVRPTQGATPELIERALRCHNADLERGGKEPVAGDPFWCPACWMDISTKSTGTGFEVDLESEDLPTAKQILTRAQTYIGQPPSEVTK
jgi:hypothetical protein